MNALDDTSAMVLCSPGIYSGVKEDAFLSLIRRCRNRNSAAAFAEVVVEPFTSHATADVLSQNIPTCLYERSGTTSSRTSQPRTMPASSKSLIVMVPFDISSFMSSGHSTCHTIFGIWMLPDTTTPPDPIPHASVYSIMCGSPGSSSWMGVGCL